MLGTLKYDSEEYSHCTVHVRLLNCYLACYANRLFWLVPSLCFTARLSAARLTWKWFSIPVEIKLIFTRKVLHLASFWKRDSEVAYLSFLGTAWRLGRCCVELHLGTITGAKSDALSYAKFVVIANRRRNSVLNNKIVMLQFDKTSTWAHVRNG